MRPMIQLAARLLARHSHVNWALADQTMVSGVNFLTGIMLARYLGLEEFGRFTLAWMVVLFAASIQHAAINSAMMSIAPKQPEADAPAYYGAVMVQQVVLGILTFALVWAGVALSDLIFAEWRVAGLALPLACAAIALQFQDFLRRYFFTRGRGMNAFTNDAVRFLGQLAVLVWLFQVMPMDSAKVLWVIAIAAAIATLYGSFLIETIEWAPDMFRAIASRHWNFSKWMTASALMQWTAGNLFIIAAGALFGATAVGALKAAQNLMGIMHILFYGLDNVVPVRAALYYRRGGKKALVTYLRRVALLGGLATGAVAVIAAAAPEFWLALVFGEQYTGFGYILRWYAVIYLAIFIGLPLRSGLRALEDTRPIFFGYAVATIIAVTSVYPLLTGLGITGAVVGILLVQVANQGVLMIHFARWARSLSGRQDPKFATVPGREGSRRQ